jgi:hypothetical protein
MNASPFDLQSDNAYQRWRADKLAACPAHAQQLVVDIGDPRALTPAEKQALLSRCSMSNMVIYRSSVHGEDKAIPLALGRQVGLRQLDGNWLADEDGISPIAVSQPPGERIAFIPYTNRPIKWHTDGYYQPPSARFAAWSCTVFARLRRGDTAR